MKNKILILICIIICFELKGQENKTTFGVQYKPIIPSKYFNSSQINQVYLQYNFDLNPKYSSTFGMIIRQKINNTFSIESGLNYTKQNYTLTINNYNLNIQDVTKFGIRSYEVPIQLLTYVQVSKLWYLNVAFGVSHNILASDILSYGEKINNFFQNTYRKNSGYQALLANIGMEYRSEKYGNYYLGASLHRPWGEISRVYPEYIEGENSLNDLDFDEKFFINISGNFITLDLRYFFPK